VAGIIDAGRTDNLCGGVFAGQCLGLGRRHDALDTGFIDLSQNALNGFRCQIQFVKRQIGHNEQEGFFADLFEESQASGVELFIEAPAEDRSIRINT